MSTPRYIRLVEFYRGRVAKATCLKWCRDGRLKTYRLDGMTFVTESFDEFVAREAVERAAKRKAA